MRPTTPTDITNPVTVSDVQAVEGIGDRVASRLGEVGLTQAEVGARLSTGRRQTWVSGVIKGRFKPSFEDAYELAGILGVTPMWLIYGQEAAGESEFVGRLQILEPDLDTRAKLNILRLAESEAEHVRAARMESDSFSQAVAKMIAAGLDRETAERAARSLVAPQSLPASDGRTAEGQQGDERREA